MNADRTSAPAASLWLGAVLAIAMGSLQVVPVLAPAVAPDAGLPPAFVGWYSAAVWTVAMLGTAAAPAVVARIGGWRASQSCLVLCAAGVIVASTGHPFALVAAAALIGVAHGLEGPVASHLLAEHVPADRRPLWFSIKQTGVQAGALVASAALPPIAAVAGWRTAAWVAAAIAAVGVVALGLPRRRYLDVQPPPASYRRQGVRAVLRGQRLLRHLSVAAAAFGAIQVCLNSFFVTYAVTERGASLVQAGAWLAAAQAGGLVGRVAWGWIGNRPRATWPLLIGLGIMMASCALLLGARGATLEPVMLWPLLVAFGMSASGWNGLLLAEVARLVPVHEAGSATAAVLMVMTIGLVAGPIVFSAIAQSASFGLAFMIWAGVAAVGVASLLAARSATGG